jgi:hypothetical protein
VTALAQTLWVPGPLPGLNEMLADRAGRGGNAYARMKKKWTNDIALLARVSKLRPMERVKLRFVWHERHRQRNPDNIAAAKKFIIDGLVTAKVLRNDGWDQIAGFVDDWLVARPAGVLVLIEPSFVLTTADGGGFANTAGVSVPVGNGKNKTQVGNDGSTGVRGAAGADEEGGPDPRPRGRKAGSA